MSDRETTVRVASWAVFATVCGIALMITLAGDGGLLGGGLMAGALYTLLTVVLRIRHGPDERKALIRSDFRWKLVWLVAGVFALLEDGWFWTVLGLLLLALSVPDLALTSRWWIQEQRASRSHGSQPT